MFTTNGTSKVRLAATASILCIAAFGTARAIPVTFNPSAAGLSTQGAFVADNYQVSDFATATINDNTGAFTETGTLRLNTFLSGPSNLFSGTTGLQNGTGAASYGLYMTFSAAGNLPGFVPGAPPAPVTGTFSSLTYTFLGDPGNNNTVSTSGVLTDAGTLDVVLATGSLAGGINSVSILGSGVPAADVLLTLTKTALGSLFFQLPTNLDLQETSFVNTTSAFTFSDNGTITTLAITGGGGNGTFAARVPEPASLALLGAGLIGLGFARHRHRRA